jgi:hypothetical protein
MVRLEIVDRRWPAKEEVEPSERPVTSAARCGWISKKFMESKEKLRKVLVYQNIGFLVIIMLGFLDELTRLSFLLFGEQPFTWEFRRATLGMLLVLAVWFLVSMSTRRILDRLRYLEKFMRVCAWCHHIDHKGRWMPLEEFLQQGFDTPTTHGICPKCLAQQKAAIERARSARAPQVA